MKVNNADEPGKPLGLRKVIYYCYLSFLVFVGLALVLILINDFTGLLGLPIRTHHDFIAFYSSGHLADIGNLSGIYKFDALRSYQIKIVQENLESNWHMPFLNPPFMALFFVPFSFLSLFSGRIAMLVLNVILMAGISVYMVRGLGGLRPKIVYFLLLITTFPAIQNYTEGQLSVLMLACSVMALHYARQKKPIISGVFLSALFIKPQIALIFGLGLLIVKQYKILVSMFGAVLAVVLALLPITGYKIYFEYVKFLLGVFTSHYSGAGFTGVTVWRGNLKGLAGINGLSNNIFGQDNPSAVTVLTVFLVGLVVLAYVLDFKGIKPSLGTKVGRQMIASFLVLLFLINPHSYVQDAILLYMVPLVLFKTRPTQKSILIIVSALQILMLGYKNYWIFTVALIIYVLINQLAKVFYSPRRA